MLHYQGKDPMHRVLLVCVGWLIPVAAVAQPHIPAPPINPAEPMIPAAPDPLHFCYYAGQPYSEGAVMKTPSGTMLRCGESNSSVLSSSDNPQPMEWQSLR